jgi:peptide/nickel transport system ATP-binding protein
MSVSDLTATRDVPAFEVRDLQRSFAIGGGWFGGGRSLRAVDGVSFTVRRGEVLAIVGESGCGKTTLSRMMLGLQAPSGGDILIDGEPVAGVERKALSRKVQPIFQDPYSSLNPRKTIGAIIADPLIIHGVGDPAERQRRVLSMMERVGLARRMEHSYPSQLSGGQRQRVAIARALVMQPAIVVCDEPTSALDVSVQAQILNLLKDLRDEFDLTYIFISHDLSVVRYMADRVAVMYFGRIVEYGPTAEVLRAPKHPYTQALLRSILTPEPGLGLPDLGIARGTPDPTNAPQGCKFSPRCPLVMPKCRDTVPPTLKIEQTLVDCHLYADDEQASLALNSAQH